jgi:hypothetical protein
VQQTFRRRVSKCTRRLISAPFPMVASRLQEKPSAAESGGVGAAAPVCDSKILKKRFVARGSEPSARQAEHSGKRGCGSGSPHLRLKILNKRFVARGSKPSARQAERSGKRGCRGGSFHLRLKKPEGGLHSRNHPRVRERKAPGRAPAGGAAGVALGRAGFGDSAPNYFQM